MEQPYNIYGGMQDNGSWKGPNTTWETAGIRNWDWQEVGFGDGFGTAPIPDDPMTGYAMSQEGYVVRWNLRTGERKDIRPSAPDAKTELRFNWNAGMAVDPFDPNGIYYGSQFVHKSSDRGESWKIISPDLTTNKKEWQQQAKSGGITPDVTGAENFTTIIAIAPSPLEKNTVWAGTDDGRVHVTRDGGANWTSVEGNIKGVPANTWVPEIKASRHDAGTAFIVFDDHRRSNWTPYVYRTTDYGKTWTSLATKDIQGYALVDRAGSGRRRSPLPRHGVRSMGVDGRRQVVVQVEARLPDRVGDGTAGASARSRSHHRHARPRRVHPRRHPPAAQRDEGDDGKADSLLRRRRGHAAHHAAERRRALRRRFGVSRRERTVRRAPHLLVESAESPAPDRREGARAERERARSRAADAVPGDRRSCRRAEGAGESAAVRQQKTG